LDTSGGNQTWQAGKIPEVNGDFNGKIILPRWKKPEAFSHQSSTRLKKPARNGTRIWVFIFIDDVEFIHFI
jgi:hypothetical protein